MTEILRLIMKKRKDLHDTCKLAPFDSKLQENYRNFGNFVLYKPIGQKPANSKMSVSKVIRSNNGNLLKC